jgi:single-strand DNA-binding protein
MLNRVVLMGRLVADPELKTTPSGVSVTSFRIAVDRSYVKQGEERKADFIDVVCWRQTAEFVCRYFGKGSLIAVDGQLQSRTYQAKDGTNRYVTEVVAENVSFTGERREQGGRSQQQYAPPNVAPPEPAEEKPTTSAFTQPPPATSFEQIPLDDDLPF